MLKSALFEGKNCVNRMKIDDFSFFETNKNHISAYYNGNCLAEIEHNHHVLYINMSFSVENDLFISAVLAEGENNH